MIKTNDTEQNDIKLCLAKTRSGEPCQKHPIAGKSRCRLHGGLGNAKTSYDQRRKFDNRASTPAGKQIVTLCT
jgi:hypothetical protein